MRNTIFKLLIKPLLQLIGLPVAEVVKIEVVDGGGPYSKERDRYLLGSSAEKFVYHYSNGTKKVIWEDGSVLGCGDILKAWLDGSDRLMKNVEVIGCWAMCVPADGTKECNEYLLHKKNFQRGFEPTFIDNRVKETPAV